MLDPPYKSLQVVENYVGRGNEICFTSEYDMKRSQPTFDDIFERLNPSIQA
jgi:hypothetical protein